METSSRPRNNRIRLPAQEINIVPAMTNSSEPTYSGVPGGVSGRKVNNTNSAATPSVSQRM